MILSSDIELRHPLWERADNELCSSGETGIFKRLVDIYVLACAIGIKDDKVILDSDISNLLPSPKTIGRNTHRENSDLRDLFDFLLQNAVIHSKTIKLDVNERLELAFNPDYTNKKIKPADFLTGFANYGIVQIYEKITSSSALMNGELLYKLFEQKSQMPLDKILESITLEDLKIE